MEKIKNRNEEVIFTNWTDETFEGKWDFAVNKSLWIFEGKTEKYPEGHSCYVPFYLAEHFGQQLVARELIKLAREEIDEELKKLKVGMGYYQQLKFKENIEKKYLSDNSLKEEMFKKTVIKMNDDDDDEIVVTRVRMKEVPEEEIRLLRRDIVNSKFEETTGTKSDFDRKAMAKAGK